ncbi:MULTISPECIES: prefoldin subunit alpha [Halorussus]|uniref:prefoldin subunit alpha n=1 Tax=Halorussus TaxID=1070314 RepID=UPI0020A02F74|nr:prefoldin subunit alpha [Halorussus vallis]USZ77696.1 prefoldin subunit alpha [Halorussus vallis]
MGGGGNPELQELSQQLQQLDEEKQELEGEIEELRNEKQEMGDAIDTIEALETGSVVQVPLGGGAHIRAKVQDIDELVVELGGGYAAEHEQDDAVETLQSKQDNVDQRISELQDDVGELEQESSQLEQKAQQLQQQQMQQQMQQMQGQQGQNDEDE